MWTYSQSTGQLSHYGAVIATGYSGAGDGKNNPGMQAVHDVGPIPQGVYLIGAPFNHEKCGPHVMRLSPFSPSASSQSEPADNDWTFGRTGFLMHGDNAAHTASEGCVIMPLAIREGVSASGDDKLEVVA